MENWVINGSLLSAKQTFQQLVYIEKLNVAFHIIQQQQQNRKKDIIFLPVYRAEYTDTHVRRACIDVYICMHVVVFQLWLHPDTYNS